MFNTKLCVSLQISAHNGDFFYDCQVKQGRWSNRFASYPQTHPGRVNVSWINALVLLMLASIFTPRLHKLVLAPYFPWCFWNKNFSASFPIKNLQNCPRVLLDSSTKGHSFNMAPCRSTTTPFPLPGLHRHLAAFLCVLYPLTCHQQLIFSQPERRTCPNIGTDLDRFGNTVEGSDIRLSLTSWSW